jgi:hypothetical protein
MLQSLRRVHRPESPPAQIDPKTGSVILPPKDWRLSQDPVTREEKRDERRALPAQEVAFAYCLFTQAC